MKSCVPCGKYILAVFVMRKIKEIVVFLMINSMCSLCRIRYGNFFVFVVDGVHNQRVNDEEIKDYFDGFQAVLDIPVILFWKDLRRIFPEAKFILTVRNADSMFESWHKTIGESLRILNHPIYRWFLHENQLVSM